MSHRDGALSVAPVDVPWEDASVFVLAGPASFRAVSGRQRGELLRVVRDGEDRVVKLYLATYPFTRTPQTYGPD